MGAVDSTINLSFHTIEEIIEQITKIGGHECFSNMNDGNYELTVEQVIAIYDQLNTLKFPCRICFLPRSAPGEIENGYGICVFCYAIPYYDGDQYSTFKFDLDESRGSEIGNAYQAIKLFWWFDNDDEVGEFWIHNYEKIINETDPKRLRELSIEYRLDEYQARQPIIQIVKQKLAMPLPIIPNVSERNDDEYWFNLKIDDYVHYRRLMINNIDDENVLRVIAEGDYHPKIKAYAASKMKNLDILFDLPLESRKYVNFNKFQFDSYSDDEMSKLIQIFYVLLQDKDQDHVLHKFDRWIASTKNQSFLKWLFENHSHRFANEIISSYNDLNAIRSYLKIEQYGHDIEDLFSMVIKRLQKEYENDCMIVLRRTMEWSWEYDSLSPGHYLLVAANYITNETNQFEIILQHRSTQVCQVILNKLTEETLLSLLKKEVCDFNIFEVIGMLITKYTYTMEKLLKLAISQENSVVYENIRKYYEVVCLEEVFDEMIDENLLKSFYVKLKNTRE